MKLFYSPTSPYARKVTALAHEVGLTDQIDSVTIDFAKPDPALLDANPLGKVPTLITDDGVCLVDSVVICDHLDSLHDQKRLIPQEGPSRLVAMNLASLAQGIMDASINQVMEKRARAKEQQSEAYLRKHQGKVAAALDVLEGQAAEGALECLNLGTLSLGCALGYLDLRFAEEGWRDGRPALAAWFAAFEQRPSMVATRPQ
ncbi:MAG: glutathione S-transferase N-terminal domain-containing protein [Pseudomonadota bacterium]